jgi:hypothetical protein
LGIPYLNFLTGPVWLIVFFINWRSVAAIVAAKSAATPPPPASV